VEIITGANILNFAMIPFSATVSGQVIDAETTLPVQGAQVSTNDGTGASTDESGEYTMTLDSGIYTLTAQSEGYMPQSFSDIEIISGTYTLDFALQPITATLTGQVLASIVLEPIPGASVSVQGGPSTLTDDNGYYTFTLTSGTYTVTAQEAGYLPQTQSVEIVSGTVVLDFVLESDVCTAPQLLPPDIAISGLAVSFSASVSGTLPINYVWEFGDGTISTLEDPVHIYQDYGTYFVRLNVENECGAVIVTRVLNLVRSAYMPLIFKTAS
jgi:PKD repeat protein